MSIMNEGNYMEELFAVHTISLFTAGTRTTEIIEKWHNDVTSDASSDITWTFNARYVNRCL